jgi:hypothetical protein
MINSIADLFQKVLTEAKKAQSESKETIMHLPHVVERAILGNPEESIAHLENGLNIAQNLPSKGSISDKADGGMSIEIKKGAVKYKGQGEWVSTPEEIKKHYKPHFERHLMAGLQLAQHPKMPKGVIYQADTLLQHPDHSNLLLGNILSYKKPRKSVQVGLAAHTVIDENTGKRIESAPDIRHMETETLFLPYLGTRGRIHSAKPEEIAAINDNISAAKKIFANQKVASVVNDIASHRHPTNQQGHMYLFLRQFNNAFQRGDFSKEGTPAQRSVDTLMSFVDKKLTSAKGNAERNTIGGHKEFFERNRSALEQILKGHAHIDEARRHIVNITKRTPSDLHPVNPETGKVDYSMGEGKVSIVPGLEPVKFVESSFTSVNAAQSAAAKARKKKQQDIQENEGGGMVMTASGGGISGMGYNIGGPAPDDVAVPPLKSRMASKAAKPFRRKIMTKLLGRMNVGRESY